MSKFEKRLDRAINEVAQGYIDDYEYADVIRNPQKYPDEFKYPQILLPQFESILVKLRPEEVMKWVEKFPEHGNEEAFHKIYTIMHYGPNYKYEETDMYPTFTKLEELMVLAKYWNLDKNKIYAEVIGHGEGREPWNQALISAQDWKPKVDEFFREYAHIFKS